MPSKAISSPSREPARSPNEASALPRPVTLWSPRPLEPPVKPPDLKAVLEERAEPMSLAPPSSHQVMGQSMQRPRTPSDPVPLRSPVRGADKAGGRGQWVAPEVCTDATLGDPLWSGPEPSSHRDSVSSSSSVSSSDTVVDLSLPNLARRGFIRPGTASAAAPAPAPHPHHGALGSKSKSNPNLRPGEPEEPRALGSARENQAATSPGRPTQRRHTWSRLYMEGLKQQQCSPSRRPPPPTAPAPSTTMSKSLGDLTSDDIACNFESKYRSISRSFLPTPSRDPRRRGSLPSSLPPGGLTERLRRLTDVEPLGPGDFAAQSPQQPLVEEEQQQQQEEVVPLRRMSSRSQSRVRYIANRAKQAQERLRLQGQAQERLRLQGQAQERLRLQGKAQERLRLQGPVQGRSSSVSLSPSPLEERGSPEGACCVAQSPCSSLDLLNQLTGPGPPGNQSQATVDPDNYSDEVFFMLRL